MRARVSSKGQLVLPKAIRERRGFDAGSEVEIEEVPGGILLRLIRSGGTTDLASLLGCTGYVGPRKTLEEMEAAIREGATRQR